MLFLEDLEASSRRDGKVTSSGHSGKKEIFSGISALLDRYVGQYTSRTHSCVSQSKSISFKASALSGSVTWDDRGLFQACTL